MMTAIGKPAAFLVAFQVAAHGQIFFAALILELRGRQPREIGQSLGNLVRDRFHGDFRIAVRAAHGFWNNSVNQFQLQQVICRQFKCRRRVPGK